MGGFVAELRRRQVLRVLGFYAITVWVIVQVAADTFAPLGIPQGVHTALVIALMLGFPVVGVLSWVFDITPQGIVRTAPAEHEVRLNEFGEAISERPRLWIDALIITVLLGMVAFLLLRPTEPIRGAGSPSIAVLPFMDISEHGDNEYFSDGITEALISNLARLPGLNVTSATSSFAYKGHKPDIKRIGEALGVATILEGSVRKAPDNRLKITAQLIDVDTNFHLWSETYDGHLDDIFSVQEDIARSIVAALQVNLIPGSADSLTRYVASDAQAYDQYLRGREQLRHALTQENTKRAIEHFEEAMRIDPRFALTDVGLCSAYLEMYQLTREDSYIDRATDACNTARSRVTDVPDLHVASGWLYLGTGRNELAQQEFVRALELDAENVEALRGLGIFQWRTGALGEAEATLRKAIEFEPSYWRVYASFGAFLFRNGRFAEAAEAFRRGIERNPDHPQLRNNLGAAYGAQGDFEKATESFQASAAIYPSTAVYRNLGINLFYLGRFEEAREMYTEAIALAPGIYENHLLLADACRHLPDGGDCADRNYRRALELAEERVRVDPNNASAVADLAMLYARTGDWSAARRMAEQAVNYGFGGYEVPLALAVVAMIEGDTGRAIELLTEAFDKGYPAHVLAVHPDFAELRDDERFQSLLNGDRGTT